MFKDLEIKKPLEELKDEINDAVDYSKFIVSHESINKTVQSYYNGDIHTGYKIGIPCFDKHFVCKEKSLYALTGKKGKGKTTINKIIQIMQSVVNDLVWVVAFQENNDWSNKIEYLQYFLGGFAKDIEKENPKLYKLASDWIDKHFYFLDVESIKEALETTEYLISTGINVHAVLLDPINSFESGYKDSGNSFTDTVYTAKKVMRWAHKNVSVYVSQHPNIKAQREKESVTPFDAELGTYNNRADFTWVVNRGNETSLNEIGVWNVREKLTGGSPTSVDEPLYIEWFPTKINIIKGSERYENVIQYLVRKHRPIDYDFEYLPESKEVLPNIEPIDAFPEDIPF